MVFTECGKDGKQSRSELQNSIRRIAFFKNVGKSDDKIGQFGIPYQGRKLSAVGIHTVGQTKRAIHDEAIKAEKRGGYDIVNAICVNNDDISGIDGERSSIRKNGPGSFREAQELNVLVPVSAIVGVSVMKSIFFEDNRDTGIRHSVFFKLTHNKPPNDKIVLCLHKMFD